MNWDAPTIERARLLWQKGVPTREMGRQLGVTTNAVLGAAHRYGFPARPSPILRRFPSGKPKHPRGQARPPELRIAKPIVVAPPPPVRPAPPPRRCCWPMWGAEPPPRPPVFCTAPADVGHPYCLPHCALAYQRVREPVRIPGYT
jgi:hypothetical protein